MTTLKNKNLRKLTKKLIFIISILMVVSLNLFGEDKEERIEFNYYYYTNKIYHSTLKTEIIPSEYVFITTYSNEYHNYNEYSYIYNLKTKEKKLYYVYNNYDYDRHYYYYDINGNLTTNWTDTNMQANEFYEITNNRFGETFYTRKLDSYLDSYDETIKITKGNYYIQKAYKYSLTQPEIINKKDRGIYLFKTRRKRINEKIISSMLCFQNEYYYNYYNIYEYSDLDYNSFRESSLLNYNSNGRVVFNNIDTYDEIKYSSSVFNFLTKRYDIDGRDYMSINNKYANNISNIYFKLNDKSFTKPTWNEFTNSYLNLAKKTYSSSQSNFRYSKEDTEDNLNLYKKLMEIEFLGFIPIEEFEYYLLAD